MDAKDKNSTTEQILDIMSPAERFLDEQHNCPLCGQEMLITQVTHFVNMQVHEEAHCESCRIKVREQEHRLQ